MIIQWVLLSTLITGIFQSAPKICYDELGCFDNEGPFFHPVYRPFNVLPETRNAINTQFLLYTRTNPKDEQFLKAGNQSSFSNSNFNSQNPIRFIIHGFTDSGLKPWIKELTASILQRHEVNVIVVNWEGGAVLKTYIQATANSRVVAAEIRLLINFLQATFGIKPQDIHIIGHSLGAHIAGYVGDETIKLGRISGLDPSELYFQGLEPVVRLDPSDANFVDVIHTDSKPIFMLGLGMFDPMGHVDFYPNGGNDQPNCDKSLISSIFTDGIGTGSFNHIMCNHMRSYVLYTQSIKNKDHFYGVECTNYDKFLMGQCICGDNDEHCAIMGYDAAPKQKRELVRFYLQTTGEPPFIIYQYQISIIIDITENVKQQGYISIELYSNDKRVLRRKQLNAESLTLTPGQSFTYLLNQNSKFEDLTKITLSWAYDSSFLNPSSWGLFKKPKLFIKKVVISPIGFEKSITFCGSSIALQPDTKMNMEECD